MARIREKRRRKRVDVELPIEIEYDKEKISARTKNISELGTYIETDKEIPAGTTLDIGINIPKTGFVKLDKVKQINCSGITFRCQPIDSLESKKQYGTGIFFRSFLRSGEKDLSICIDYILLQEKKRGKLFMRRKKQKLSKRKGGKR